jgi:hypothetical protein
MTDIRITQAQVEIVRVTTPAVLPELANRIHQFALEVLVSEAGAENRIHQFVLEVIRDASPAAPPSGFRYNQSLNRVFSGVRARTN